MDVGEGSDGRADNTSPQATLPYAMFSQKDNPMTLEEIKKAAGLAREIEELKEKYKTLSQHKDCSPRVSFSYSSRIIGYSYFTDSFTITRYEAMELLEKRLANLKADLHMMGVKT